MPIAEYHASAAVSKTTLDLVARDPYLVQWAKSAPQDTDKTGAVDFGDAMHALVLEPKRFAGDFSVMPKLDLRTKDGKAQRDEFIAANADKRILTAEDAEQLYRMADSIMAHSQARELLQADGEVERSFFWRDDETLLECKCRPDKIIQSASLLVDLKTTPSLDKFCYAVEDFRYYVQAPWYCDGVEHHGLTGFEMVFLVVQKSVEIGRYPVTVVKLPDEAVMYGRQQYRRNLREYRDFLARPAAERVGTFRELKMHGRFLEDCLNNLEVTV